MPYGPGSSGVECSTCSKWIPLSGAVTLTVLPVATLYADHCLSVNIITYFPPVDSDAVPSICSASCFRVPVHGSMTKTSLLPGFHIDSIAYFTPELERPTLA